MEADDNNFFSVPVSILQLHPGTTGKSCIYADIAQKVLAAIDPGVVKKIAGDLGLSFVPVKEKESEVCFINSEEVRPEFRLSFAPVDVADYIFGASQDPENKTMPQKSPDTALMKIPYPKDTVSFWGLVKAGEQLR